MKEFCALKAQTYVYLMDDDSEKKKAKGTEKCIIKRQLMFENYKDCFFNNKIVLESQQRFKSDCDDVYTKQINKTAQSSNDKRLQTFDGNTTYPHGTNAFKVCKSEMMALRNTQNACLMAKSYHKNLKMIVTCYILHRSMRLYDDNKILQMRFKCAFKACIIEISKMKNSIY